VGFGDERDPIIGLQKEEATFTIPKDPVRRLVRGIETFNVPPGGEVLLHAKHKCFEMAFVVALGNKTCIHRLHRATISRNQTVPS